MTSSNILQLVQVTATLTEAEAGTLSFFGAGLVGGFSSYLFYYLRNRGDDGN